MHLYYYLLAEMPHDRGETARRSTLMADMDLFGYMSSMKKEKEALLVKSIL